MSEEIIPCPVCGSSDIGEIRGNNGVCGPGYYSYAITSYCKNCGVKLMADRKPIKRKASHD